MTKVAVLALLLATGCSKPTPEKACKHVIDLSIKEVDRQLDHLTMAGGDYGVSMRGELVATKKEMQSRRTADVEKCMTRVEQSDIDTGCLMDAERLDGVLKCFGRLDPEG